MIITIIYIIRIPKLSFTQHFIVQTRVILQNRPFKILSVDKITKCLLVHLNYNKCTLYYWTYITTRHPILGSCFAPASRTGIRLPTAEAHRRRPEISPILLKRDRSRVREFQFSNGVCSYFVIGDFLLFRKLSTEYAQPTESTKCESPFLRLFFFTMKEYKYRHYCIIFCLYIFS